MQATASGSCRALENRRAVVRTAAPSCLGISDTGDFLNCPLYEELSVVGRGIQPLCLKEAEPLIARGSKLPLALVSDLLQSRPQLKAAKDRQKPLFMLNFSS